LTNIERVQAVVDFGFTERQARFLVLVLRHGGVCVPRQYATLAGIAHGGKECNALFEKLVSRKHAVGCHCLHNRARLYHVHHQALYRAIGEHGSRYQRRVPARRVVERVMLLDAVLTTSHVDWLTTVSGKVAYLAALAGSAPAADPHNVLGDPTSRTRAECVGTFAVGIDPNRRAVLLYLAQARRPTDFGSSSRRIPHCCA
jgi:hypothetical protein